MKFIDTFTEGNDRTWEVKKFVEESDRVDLKFREALEFSKSLDDDMRTANLQVLRVIFEEDETYLRGKGRLLTQIEASTLATTSAYGYDRAIKGECVRPGNACK
ncbi:hypothetical protein IPU70_00690 [Achromobacter sp. SD115]|uniref:hypothetical protein n=1 Tax=Achromobacter TaxID=222 RepID=UPI001A976BE0|nr:MULTISPECIES: hypothetical protein [Achromobacter]MBO1012044.1 hypothetical protein [Achromobacter sp. SD115]WLW64516.1 hypothetical protein RA224_14100 [Achromobacter aegrifaciens]